MTKKPGWGLLVLVSFICILLIDMVLYHARGPLEIEHNNNLPPRDNTKEVFIFDFYDGEWVYKDDLPNRANGYSSPSGSSDDIDIEKEIDEHLEEHIDGYKEDTWFGEEWDYNNK